MARTAIAPEAEAPAYATERVEPGSRPLPWNVMGGGLDIDTTDLDEALTIAGLDYTVETRALYAGGPAGTAYTVEAPTLRAIVRPMPDGTEKVLAACGTRFTPAQNRDAFAVVRTLTGEHGARIVGAADFHHGGASVLVARLGRTCVGGTDQVDLDLVIKNAHDASGALTFALTPVRFSCTNALQAAIAGAQRVWKIHHTAGIQAHMDLAHQAILKAAGYQAKFAEVADRLAGQPMVDAEFAKIVDRLWPVRPDAQDPKTVDQRQRRHAELMALYQNSATLEGIRGTRWGGYNALTEYMDHYRPVRPGKGRTADVMRAEGALDGPSVKLKERVWGMFAKV